MHRSIGVVDLQGTNPCIAYGEDQSTLDNFFRKAGAYVNLWITLDPPASSAFDALMVMKKHPKFNNYQSLIDSQLKKYEEPALPQFDPNQKVNRAVEASQILTESERLQYEAALKEKKFVHWLSTAAKDPGNGHFVHTPLPLAKEMIDKLGELHNKKILVMFNLEFIWELVKAGVPTCNIWYITDNEYWHAAVGAMKTFKGINNIAWAKGPEAMSAAIEETGMKFDVVIGNPPYQNVSTGEAKRWVLWHKFVEMAHTMTNDTVAFVTPSSWFSSAGIIELLTTGHLQWVSTDVAKYFSEGSTFSAWISHKRKSEDLTVFKTDREVFSFDINGIKFIPSDITPRNLQLNQKFFVDNEKFDFVRTTEYHTSKKQLFAERGNTAVFHTNATTLFSDVAHLNNTLHRVAITLSGYPNPRYLHNEGATQAVAWCKVESEFEGKNLETILKSKLYQFFLKLNKWSGWNDLTVIKRLPKVDLTRTWTDQELYQHFGLTEDEVAYIESVVK